MSETTDEVLAIWATLGSMGAWAGRKAYHGARVAGMKWQNWRHGGAGESSPATTSGGSPAGASGSKWTSIETTETTSYYHHSSTKWSREDQEG